MRARIILSDPGGEEVIGVFNTNVNTGRFLMVLTPGQRYTMTVEAPGYVSQRTELFAKAADDGVRELPMDILMVPLEASSTRK